MSKGNVNSVRNVSILGATGSIGVSAQSVARALPDCIRIVGMASASNKEGLLAAAREFQPLAVCLAGAGSCEEMQGAWPQGTRTLAGRDGLMEVATLPEADIVLVAIVGTAGLEPALAAIEAGKDLAVASKEILVMAGGVVMEAAARKGVRILPVDSEHNAIFQCLEGSNLAEVHGLHLTCSGGPFRDLPASGFAAVTPEMALTHPTWNMGKKISIDSATLFNKGLEMIEARWLFGIEMERISVVIHPQSIVHSLVEFVDGSILAQLSVTDMGFPIQFALTYPERLAGGAKRLNLHELGTLVFRAPREEDFPALGLARSAGSEGGTKPAVLNAANEEAVRAFLLGKIPFPAIWEHVQNALEEVAFCSEPGLPEILTADASARAIVREACGLEEAVGSVC